MPDKRNSDPDLEETPGGAGEEQIRGIGDDDDDDEFEDSEDVDEEEDEEGTTF